MTSLKRKLVGIIFCTTLLLCTTLANSAHAEAQASTEGGKQTQAQVIVQIVSCAIFLRILDHFGLP